MHFHDHSVSRHWDKVICKNNLVYKLCQWWYQTNIHAVLLVLFMPLLSAIVSGFFGRPIGIKGTGALTSGYMGISLVVSCIYYETILNSSVTYIKL